MRVYIALVVTLLLVLTTDARRRFRPQQEHLSQCKSVIMSQGRSGRDCSEPIRNAIKRDLMKIHHSDRREFTAVLQRWVDDRARALDPTIDVQTLLASGSCNRMMCFKQMVDDYVRRDNYQVPHFCRRKTGRQYVVKSLTLRRTRHWTVDDMKTVFCAKAYDPNFKFHP